MSEINKKPGQTKARKIKNEALLPSILQTEPNKKMLGATLNAMTSKGQMLPFKETHGHRTAPSGADTFFKQESDPVRRESMANTAIIANDDSGNFLSKTSYLDLENYFRVKGLPLKDGVQLDSDILTLELPIDYRRLVDYQLYYWVDHGLPAIRLHLDTAKYTISTDILSKPFVTVKDDLTGKELEFASGQTVYFTGEQEQRYLTTDLDKPKLFYIVGIGSAIRLLDVGAFDERLPTGYFKKRPWDKLELAIDPPSIRWDSENWDGSRFSIGSPEYVVMRRFTPDANHWSSFDRWYHISAIRAVTRFLDLDIEDIARNDNQARRPIISFNSGIRLYNWPRRSLGEVKTLLSGAREDYQTRTNIVDSLNYKLKNGDKVIFEKTQGIWRVSNIGTGAQFTLTQNSADYDGVMLTALTSRLYYRAIYKNSIWQLAQNKVEPNQTPLFEFFDTNGTNLENVENANFRGGVILGFMPGPTYDIILNKYVTISNIDYDAIDETKSGAVGANQIKFTTDIDRDFGYFNSVTKTDVSMKGPWAYSKAAGNLPFYIPRQGLDLSPQLQDLTYEEYEDEAWSVEIIPAVNGFNELHVYPNNNGDVDLYYKLNGLALTKFTTKTSTNNVESFIPLVSGGIFKIYCHGLEHPLALHGTGMVNNVLGPVDIAEQVISNNGITNGVITLDLSETYNNGTEYVVNEFGQDRVRLYWSYNNSIRTAIVKPIEKWRFINNAYYLDKSSPVYHDYDYNITDSTAYDAGLTFKQKLTGTVALSNKATTGDKIGLESFITNNTDKTAPISLTINPLNQTIDTLNYYSLYQHGRVSLSASPTARESTDPGAVYYDINNINLRFNGGTLIKHNNPLAKTALVAAAMPFDLTDILIKQGKHYDTFMTRLITELKQVINNYDTEKYTQLQLIGLALDSIYVNQKDNDNFWYHSNMIGWGQTVNTVDIALTSNLELSLLSSIGEISHVAGKERLMHIVADGRVLNRSVDYQLVSELEGYYTKVIFASEFANKTVTINYWPDTFNSRVPASLAKIGLSACYVPEIYRDSSYSGDVYFIIRHDGSKYYLEDGASEVNGKLYPVDTLDQLLFEYEKAIWSSIARDIEINSFKNLYKNIPGAFRTTRYTYGEVLELTSIESYAWMQDNNIFTFKNTTYDQTNPFTYNYQIGTGDDDTTITGTWRAVYKYYFDTDRPHTHPWEMLAHTVKPTWWDAHYSWTDEVKRNKLITALATGNRAEPGTTPDINVWLARSTGFDESFTFPVDYTTGELLAPTQVAWLAEVLDYSEEHWQPGDISPYEQVFLSTQRGVAAQAKTLYMTSPTTFVNDKWVPGNVKINEFGHRLDKETGFWLSPNIEHVYHRQTNNDGSINFTAGIESLFAEFCILYNRDFATEVVAVLNNTEINKEFLLSGFSNNNNVRMQSTSTPNQTTSLFVPEESYTVRTLHHYPENEDFYSAMRIVWDGSAWAVYGFTNENSLFSYFVPVDGSSTVSQTVGNFTIKEKTNYNKKDVAKLRYGTLFTTRQDLYDFIIGYGKYLENIGFVFEDVETGDVRNWQLSAKQFIFWSNDPLEAGNYIDLNPAADRIVIKKNTTQLSNLLGSNINVGQIVDRLSQPMFSNDILVNRDDADSIVITPRSANKPVYGIKLIFVTYESVLHLSGRSAFNDIYFLPEQATSKRSYVLAGKKTDAWTGKYDTPGYIISGTDIIPNYDTMADTGRTLLDVENVLHDTDMLEASRGQFGLNRNPELRQLFLQEQSETLFKTGIAFTKGTQQVFNALEPLTHKDGSNTIAYEEYMVRTGEFGNTSNIDFYEFEITQADLVKDPQIIKFQVDDLESDRIIYVGDRGSRWVHKPYGKNLRFNTFNKNYSIFNTTGPVINGDTDYIVSSVDTLTSMYADFEQLWSIPAYDATASYKKNEQVRINGRLYVANKIVSPNTWTVNQAYFSPINEPYLPNVFVEKYDTGSTWQVLQLMDLDIGITEACPGPSDTSKARIATNKNHGLVKDDLVLLVNADNGASSVNGVWRVDGIEQIGPSHYFYINTNIPGTIKTGKVFVFRPVRFKTEEELNAAKASGKYVWNKKFNPRDNALGTANIIPPLTASGYSTVYPVAIVDDAVGSDNTIGFGNYKVYQLSKDEDNNDIATVVKSQSLPVDPGNIEHLVIYNKLSGKTLAKVDIFDPKKFKLPQVFLDDIDIVNRVDPAKYTQSSDPSKNLYISTAWYDANIGRRWWDTSTAQFEDYESGTDIDRSKYWGKTINDKNPDIYEWTKSTVHPSQWESQVKNKKDMFGDTASGEAYFNVSTGVKNYYWTEKTEQTNGQNFTVYYFWVKNKTAIPKQSKKSRVYSASQLSAVLLNPSAAGIPWWAPVSNDSMIIKGVSDLITDAGTVIQIKLKSKGEEKNQQWLFVSDNNPLFIIPEWMHLRMRDSLATFVTLKYQENNQVFYTNKRVPDLNNLHPYNRVGNSIRPYMQSWFKDPIEARRTFIKKVNQLLLTMDLTNGLENWDQRLSQTNYTLGDQVIDMTTTWYYADYKSSKYDDKKSITNVFDTQADLLNANVYQGEYVKVTGQNVIYEKQLDGGYDVVFRYNGTIQFVDDLYKNVYSEVWGDTPWDYDLNAQISVIVDALRYNIFVQEYRVNYVNATCAMLRYVLSEQLDVDWVLKASTVLSTNVAVASFTRDHELQRDNLAVLNTFYKSVKAFRDKTRGGDISKNQLEDNNIAVEEFPVLNIQLNYNRHDFGSTEQLGTTLDGLRFVNVGWDDDQAKWDNLPFDPDQADNSALIEKIYKGYSGIPAGSLDKLITGSVKGKYHRTGLGEEVVYSNVTDNLILNITHENTTVREHYHNNTMAATVLLNETSLTTAITGEVNFIALSDMSNVPDASYENMQAIWVNNERIAYAIREESGISGLVRCTAGTTMQDHSIDSPVYIENSRTKLHGYIPLQSLNNTTQFYNDPGKSLADSENLTAVNIMNYSTS
jgi:hypothetical protein